MKTLFMLTLIIAFIASIPVYAGEFIGQIHTPDLQTQPNITIKLTPPKSTTYAQEITVSDDKGQFQFNNINTGPYLMEMYHGNDLIRREVINIQDTQDTERSTIELVPEY